MPAVKTTSLVHSDLTAIAKMTLNQYQYSYQKIDNKFIVHVDVRDFHVRKIPHCLQNHHGTCVCSWVNVMGEETWQQNIHL